MKNATNKLYIMTIMTFCNKLRNLTKIKENQKKCHFENFAAITLSSRKYK